MLDRLKGILGIRSVDELTVRLDDGKVSALRRYLDAIDVIKSMPVVTEDPGVDTSGYTICIQPGLRSLHAEALIAALESDPAVMSLPDGRREAISALVRDTVAGHILEEMVLYDTLRSAGRGIRVFKLVMVRGEVDMVVADTRSRRCALVEVKHSASRHPRQSRHLRSDRISGYVERRFGSIAGWYVIYRGEDAEVDGIRYLNAARYLGGLPDAARMLLEDEDPSGDVEDVIPETVR